MSLPTGIASPTDIDNLQNMIDLVGDVLKHLIKEDFNNLVPKASFTNLAELHRQFDSMTPIIERRIREARDYIRANAREIDFQTSLENHGMLGEELQLKKNNLELAWDSYKNRRNLLPKKGKKIKKTLKLLSKPLFGIMNSILGSLSSVIPGLSAVQEIKEHYENITEFPGQEKSWWKLW